MSDIDKNRSPDTDISQDMQSLDSMLARLRITASPDLRARILAIPMAGAQTHSLAFTRPYLRPYLTGAFMAMAACLLIGLFTQPLIGSFFELNMLISTDPGDLLFPDFDPWQI